MLGAPTFPNSSRQTTTRSSVPVRQRPSMSVNFRVADRVAGCSRGRPRGSVTGTGMLIALDLRCAITHGEEALTSSPPSAPITYGDFHSSRKLVKWSSQWSSWAAVVEYPASSAARPTPPYRMTRLDEGGPPRSARFGSILERSAMNRRSFLQETLYLSVAAACARETAVQGTIDPALERYRRLQTAALKSRKLDYTERDVDVAPLRLRAHVIEAGRGEPLLLIHGGNGVGAHWVPLMTRLGGWRMIVPDRPGCGLTDGFLYDGVDMRAHGAAFVEGVLDALEIEATSIIGNSMGGYFALCFALAHPERVRKLVLAGGPAGSARAGSGVPAGGRRRGAREKLAPGGPSRSRLSGCRSESYTGRPAGTVRRAFGNSR